MPAVAAMDDLQRVTSEYQALHARVCAIERESERLDVERLELLARLGEVEVTLRVLRRLHGEPDLPPGTLPLHELQAMTVARACERLLQTRGGEASAIFLVRSLEDAGKFSRGTRSAHYGTLVRTLKRRPQTFFQPSTGRWGLVEMRPDRAAPAIVVARPTGSGSPLLPRR